MIALVAYDISRNSARTRLHKYLKEFGLNTQKSVFECDVDEQAVRRILSRARELMDEETDSLRVYMVCAGCVRKVQISGQGIKVTQLEYAIV
jgi:CRISPR-associated protein Cas2